MKRSTFNYIKQILKDYSQVDDHIKKRMEELQYPYRPDDVNSGIKGNGQTDNMANLMITIEQDRRLSALERNKKVVEDNLSECGKDTETIITELYIKRYPKYMMEGLLDPRNKGTDGEPLLKCGRTKAYQLRDNFFENIANDLGLDK